MAGAREWIDSATPVTSLRRYKDGKELRLVMSDEFETPGRSFRRGADKLFEAIEKPDDTNQAIQFYNSSTDYVTTRAGSLVISTKAVKTSWLQWGEGLAPSKGTKNYTSGMVQTWNKFCFTGGVLEMSIRLPGKADSGGLWPAAWLMGNLARATYDKSVQYVWPWSYDTCGKIRDLEGKQEINACDAAPPSGMRPHQGRGAPEIDIFEVMPGHQMPGHEQPIRPFMSTSLQISPGVDKARRPVNGRPLNASADTWYGGLRFGTGGEYNEGFWGQECGPVVDDSPERVHKYMEDAISANTWLNESHFDSHHTYRLEWQPGAAGYLQWFLDGDFVFGIDGRSVAALTGALIPVEPMYLVLNTAISHRWGMPEPCDIAHCPSCWRCYDCAHPDCQCTLPLGMRNCKNLPAEMEVDFIRLYQDATDETHSVGCSPERYPTKTFIEEHAWRYEDWRAYEGVLAGAGGPATRASALLLLALLAAAALLCRGRLGRRYKYAPLLSDRAAPLAYGGAEEGLELRAARLPREPI